MAWAGKMHAKVEPRAWTGDAKGAPGVVKVPQMVPKGVPKGVPKSRKIQTPHFSCPKAAQKVLKGLPGTHLKGKTSKT